MANQYKNKVVYDGNVLIDLTQDTAVATDVASGRYFHLATGERVQGTSTLDADTSDANATASDMRLGKTGYVNGNKVTGNIPDISANVVVTSKSGTAIPLGYSDGSYKAVIDSASSAALVPNNLRQGVTVLGVEGTLSGEDELVVGPATATPTSSQQIITAASLNYDYITQVTVAAIPYSETDNAQGGVTVTIG